MYKRQGMECVVGVDGGKGLALRFELCVWISVSNSVCDYLICCLVVVCDLSLIHI